jgi:hypothetical protein
MAYLNCPNCGLTMFDRNPLTSPRHCPRCVRRGGASIELERIAKLRGGAAASLLGGMLRREGAQETPDAAGDLRTS